MQSSKAVGFVSRLAATVALVFVALSFADGAKPPSKPPSNPPLKPPFEITEDRPRCNNYSPQRQALFGTTHLHTGLSFDASIRFVDYASGNNPRGAYPQRVQLHQLRGLRERFDAPAQQLARQRDLPQRPRGQEAGQRSDT